MSRGGKTSIERDEGDRLCQLPLEVQTTGKLDRVAGTKRMPQEKLTRVGGDLRNHLDDGERGQIALQRGEDSVATWNRQRTIASATDDT
jgi:hypothetical protein